MRTLDAQSGTKYFVISVMTLGLLGCVTAFTYHFYGMKDVVFDHGILLGPSEKEDLPFSKCAPNSQSKNACVVMFSREFFALKQDYEDTKQKLSQCEKSKPLE